MVHSMRLRHAHAFALQTLFFIEWSVRRNYDVNSNVGVDKAFEHKQVAVTGHNAVGIASDRSAENRIVVRVAANLRGESSGFDDFHIGEYKLNDIRNRFGSNSKLSNEYSPELIQSIQTLKRLLYLFVSRQLNCVAARTYNHS